MKEALTRATIAALATIRDRRFYATERGFQGRLYCALQELLTREGLLDGERILEQEYQKGHAHGTHQRPDIIMHVPREASGQGVESNNFAVWALKRRAKTDDAHDDFGKLDHMFTVLQYPVGFFVNIDSTAHHAEAYEGNFRDRLVCLAVGLAVDGPTIVCSDR